METQTKQKKTAGAFDIRNIIGLLLGIYGVILLGSYFLLDPGVNPDTGEAKNPIDNLWVGIALIVVCAVFVLWSKLNPIIVADSQPGDDDE